jgi:branched-chain amino acid transport system permease protein
MSLMVVILVQASFYALLAAGYVLIYRSTRVLNLAHGELMVFGAFVFYQALLLYPDGPVGAVVLGLAGGAALGALVYVLVMRPLAGYPTAVGVLATIALSILLRSGITLVWGGQTRYPAELMGRGSAPFELPAGIVLAPIDLALLVAAAGVLLGLPWLLQRAATGVAMRGVAENALLAAQRGVDIHRVNALSWGAAGLMAAAAGIFFALKVRLGPDIWFVGLAGFAPALIGGMDSLRGVAIGALIVATAEVLAAHFIAPQWALAAPFLVLLVALWVRPWGIYGSREELERV